MVNKSTGRETWLAARGEEWKPGWQGRVVRGDWTLGRQRKGNYQNPVVDRMEEGEGEQGAEGGACISGWMTWVNGVPTLVGPLGSEAASQRQELRLDVVSLRGLVS